MPSDFFALPELDRRLMEALTEVEDSKTASGYPSWIAHDPENMGWFRAETVVDFAQAPLDKAQKDAREAKRDPEPGAQWFVRYLRASESPDQHGDAADDGPQE